MKFEREIPIGLDARRKNDRGGLKKPPLPNGIRVNGHSIFAMKLHVGNYTSIIAS